MASGGMAVAFFLAGATLQLHSPHFQLTTDRDANEAARIIASAEQADALARQLVRTVLPNAAEPELPTEIFLVGGAGETAFENALENSPARFSVATYDENARHKLLYGLLWRWLHAQAAGAQVWLATGLAEYFAEAQSTSKEIVVGLPPPDFVFFDRKKMERVHGPAFIAVGDLPSVAELLASRPADFEDAKRGHLFCAGAWLLVQLLSHADYHAIFSDYLRALVEGRPNAFVSALGKTPLEQVENEYRNRWIDHPTKRVLPALVFSSPVLETAQALPPPDAPVLAMQAGRAEEKSGDLPAAEADYRKAATALVSNSDAWLSLGRVLARREAKKSAAERKPDAIAEAAEPLSAIAKTASECVFVARYYAQKNEPAKAREFAERAAKRLPNCPSCFDMLAIAAFEERKIAEAAKLERLALSLLPDPSLDKGIVKRASDYAALAASVEGTVQK
jgi:tetratricopeptide (TPR) repeat protein